MQPVLWLLSCPVKVTVLHNACILNWRWVTSKDVQKLSFRITSSLRVYQKETCVIQIVYSVQWGRFYPKMAAIYCTHNIVKGSSSWKLDKSLSDCMKLFWLWETDGLLQVLPYESCKSVDYPVNCGFRHIEDARYTQIGQSMNQPVYI